MTRARVIEAKYRAEIQAAARAFGDHEEMSAERVLKWMIQFNDVDLNLAAKVLGEINYFDAKKIRRLTGRLLDSILTHFHGVPGREIAFVPVGGPGSGSTTIARALGETARARLGERPRLISMAEMEGARGLSAIALFDDFAGSGATLRDWWLTVEPLVLPKRARWLIGLLVLNGRARAVIEEVAGGVVAAEELGAEANVLGVANVMFEQAEKARLRHYCKRTRCGAKFQHGFNGCGLLVAFRHSCPNNSLPILWFESRSWSRLFRRRAI